MGETPMSLRSWPGRLRSSKKVETDWLFWLSFAARFLDLAFQFNHELAYSRLVHGLD